MPIPSRANNVLTSCKPVPGGGDDAHRPRRDDIRKTQRRAVDDRGARARPHQQQTMFNRVAFERHLIVEGHVVTEQQHVQVLS